jgi:hypothetical protein
MEQPESTSNSSSFEDLTKDNDVKESEADVGFMDILGNNTLTKKVGQSEISQFDLQLTESLSGASEGSSRHTTTTAVHLQNQLHREAGGIR